MKPIIKICIILFICASMGITVATATTDDKLPAKEEVTSLISEMKGSTPSEILDKIKSDHPAWTADLWKCSTCAGNQEAISLYYADSASATGHRSIYFKDGQTVSPSSLKGYTLKEKYIGELGKSSDGDSKEDRVDSGCKSGTCNMGTTDTESETTEDEDVTNDEKQIVIKGDETNTDHKYDSFKTALDKYDGTTSCTSMNCATSMKDYFKELGWTTSVKYCIAVDTSDEGTVYVVLGT